MRRINFPFLAGGRCSGGRVGQAFLPVLLALSVALPIAGATRPHYGGTLRVEMRARVTSLDPREMPSEPAESAAAEKIFSLVFERLVGLDENGRPQPALAVAWTHAELPALPLRVMKWLERGSASTGLSELPRSPANGW